jgi:hypothetical protein
MVNSYRSAIFARMVPSCRAIAACELGGRGAGRRRMHDFYENRLAVSGEGLPMHLKAGGDALVVSGLAEISHRGGHLEWTVELLLSA